MLCHCAAPIAHILYYFGWQIQLSGLAIEIYLLLALAAELYEVVLRTN